MRKKLQRLWQAFSILGGLALLTIGTGNVLSQSAHEVIIDKAAVDAGIVAKSVNGAPLDVQRKSSIDGMAVAFDPGSPLDALDRLVALAANAPLTAGKGQILPGQLCKFIADLEQSPSFRQSSSWRTFKKIYGDVWQQLLYGSEGSSCGKGILTSINVKRGKDGKMTVEFLMKDNLDVDLQTAGANIHSKGTATGNGDERKLIFHVDQSVSTTQKALSDFETKASNYKNDFMSGNVKAVRASVSKLPPASDAFTAWQNSLKTARVEGAALVAAIDQDASVLSRAQRFNISVDPSDEVGFSKSIFGVDLKNVSLIQMPSDDPEVPGKILFIGSAHSGMIGDRSYGIGGKSSDTAVPAAQPAQ